MKVLLIANYKSSIGGISGQVELLYKKLLKEGVTARIFSMKYNSFVRLFLPLRLIFVGYRYDVFHIHACSHWGFLPAIAGIMIGRLLNRRIILTYHGGEADVFFKRHPVLVNYFLRKTDVNIVLSGFIASIFEKNRIPYRIVSNILELDNKYFRERTAVRPCFISIRTLSPTYNIGCIIKAFEIVQKQIPTSELYIVGDGCSRKELEFMVEQKGIKNICFCGHVDNCEIYSYLNKADIFISSPVIDNQPMSVLEAFNAGLLVISSNVGGVPYMIENGRTGLLFESDNFIELSGKMLWAVNNQERVLKMTREAYKSLSYYSWENIKSNLLLFYEK